VLAVVVVEGEEPATVPVVLLVEANRTLDGEGREGSIVCRVGEDVDADVADWSSKRCARHDMLRVCDVKVAFELAATRELARTVASGIMCFGGIVVRVYRWMVSFLLSVLLAVTSCALAFDSVLIIKDCAYQWTK